MKTSSNLSLLVGGTQLGRYEQACRTLVASPVDLQESLLFRGRDLESKLRQWDEATSFLLAQKTMNDNYLDPSPAA